MRLLVYGGNQHDERRRIGEWPEALSVQVFQDTYGSSMRDASYGVGILDDSPFVILRKIENFSQRAYPLIVLFDPGRETWERFGWNGAHLLWALFGNVESPGIRLITGPESYHSEQHLGRLLGELDESLLPQPDEEPLDEAEPLLNLWSGAAFSEAPLIVPSDPRLMGFSARPDLKVLSFLLGKLPPSLRCGKGWLFGGRAHHAGSLGAHLVFDDGKTDSPVEAERTALLELQQQGADLRSALDTLSFGDDAGDGASLSNKYLTEPLYTWDGDDMGTLSESLHDILLLKDLKDRWSVEQVFRQSEVDDRYGRINRRLREEGPLNEQIAAAAYRLVESADRQRTAEETLFILNNHGRRGKSSKLKDKLRSSLDEDAAFAYFVEKKIYPADAIGFMPEAIRAGVCKKLLETETWSDTIPDIFSKEATSSLGYEEDDLHALLEAAVKRSAELPSGLLCWQKLFKDKELGDMTRAAVQKEALRRTQADNTDSLVDYLLLGDDAGGGRLSESKPVFKQGEALERLIDFIVRKLKEKKDGELAQKSETWLKSLAESDLRLSVGLREKDEIASLLKNGWKTYAFLRQAFRGETTPSATVPRPDAEERKFLSRELTAIASKETDPHIKFIPDLEALSGLLHPDHLDSIVDSLYGLEPVLANREPERWINGWLRLDKSESELEDHQRQSCRSKHQSEFVRLILETDLPLRAPDKLNDLDEEQLLGLFRALLWDGGEGVDARRLARFVEVLGSNSGSEGVKETFRQAYRELMSIEKRRDAFARRLLGDKDARRLLADYLSKEERSDFDQLVAQKILEARQSARQEIVYILTSATYESSPDKALLDVKKQADAIDQVVFGEALTKAFERILDDEELKNSYLSSSASGGDSLSLCKENLPKEMKQRLRELEGEKKQRERARRIEACILEGDDDEARQTLSKMLQGKTDSNTGHELDAAVRQALSSPAKSRILFGRFVPAVSVKNERGMISHKLKAGDPLLNHLFKNLKPETSLEFLNKLWNDYDGDRNPVNPLTEASREIFRRLVENKDHSGKAKGKKAKTKNFTPNHFEESVLFFLGQNPVLRKTIGHWELGADKAGLIDNYLGAYLSQGVKEDTPPPKKLELETTESVWGPLIGIGRMTKSLFTGGNKSRTNQEGDDQ